MSTADLVKRLKEKKGPRQLDLVDYLKKLTGRRLTVEGKEKPDPTPMAPPIGYKRQPSMVEIVRNMVQSERLAAEARASGHETFEESEDFDIGDDPPDMKSAWENEFDPPLPELLKAGSEAAAAKAAEAAPPSDGPGASKPPKSADGSPADPPKPA